MRRYDIRAGYDTQCRACLEIDPETDGTWAKYADVQERISQLEELLIMCIPSLHTGDELPISYYVENAPDCLLSKVAKAVNYKE